MGFYFKMNTIGKIYISQPLIKHLNLPIQPHIKIRVGNLEVFSRLEVTADKGLTYSLSKSLANAIYMKRRPLKIRYDRQENAVRLGPIIGNMIQEAPKLN